MKWECDKSIEKRLGQKLCIGNLFPQGQHSEGAYKGSENLPDDIITLNLLIDGANKDMVKESSQKYVKP